MAKRVAPQQNPTQSEEIDNEEESCTSNTKFTTCSCGNVPNRHQVKKDGENKGKYFWSCSENDGGCGGFMWDEDAKALPNGSEFSKGLAFTLKKKNHSPQNINGKKNRGIMTDKTEVETKLMFNLLNTIIKQQHEVDVKIDRIIKILDDDETEN
jgi:hypothetical protein